MLRPLPYCDAVSRHDETKTIKPTINKAFVASSGDIITDYNDIYCLFTRRVNITMSAFVIGETTNNKHYSILLKIRQKCQTVLAKLELPQFIETAFVQASIVGYSSRFRKQSSVNCAAHALIFGLNCSGTVL